MSHNDTHRSFEGRQVRILGPEDKEVAEGWRDLYHEVLYQTEENEMGMACSTYGEGDMCADNFAEKPWSLLEELDVGRRIILKWV